MKALLLALALAQSSTLPVTKVVDGDTFAVDTASIQGSGVLSGLQFHVRVLGIDTPEHAPLAKCKAEIKKADQATVFAKQLIVKSGGRVTLSDVQWDKYGGRIDAKVTLADGTDFGSAMIAAGLAHSYDGGAKASWCH